MRRLISILSVAVAFIMAASTFSFAQSWEHLGTRQVTLKNESDVIHVGRNKGRYRNLQIRVRGNDIFFRRLLITFGNGRTQTIVLNQRVREGAISSPIDLKGDARFIRKIVMVYKRIANFKGKAFVSVYGREHGAFVNPIKWKLLGKNKVNLLRDKDVIAVGRNKGRFRRLQIRVTGNDIFFKRMTVVFGNGATQSFTLNRTVREGTISRSIDLKGEARFIKRIHLNYKRRLKTVFRGKAHVSIYGK